MPQGCQNGKFVTSRMPCGSLGELLAVAHCTRHTQETDNAAIYLYRAKTVQDVVPASFADLWISVCAG